MARFVSGNVVVVPFPFTDFSASKVRPALVLATFTRGDVLLCQITSQAVGHPEAVPISTADFLPGGVLPRPSFVLPHRIVTAHESSIRRVVGTVSVPKLQEIRDRVCAAVHQG